jgi:hypothetical protein
LTARQSRILEVIRDTVRDRGYPPTLRELTAAVGIGSSSTASEQLRILQARGYIRVTPNTPRGIMLLDPADEPTLEQVGVKLSMVRGYPDHQQVNTCPGCGVGKLNTTVGITRVGYTYEVCTCRDGGATFDHLIEQLWHRDCLTRSGCP